MTTPPFAPRSRRVFATAAAGAAIGLLALTVTRGLPAAAQGPGDRDLLAPPPGASLVPTNHPVVPRDETRLWFAPPGTGAAGGGALQAFAGAMELADRESYAEALPLLSRPAVQQGVLGHYAIYYAGLAELRLGRAAEARRAFAALQARPLVGYLSEAAAFAEAECAEALDDYAGAVAIYARLTAARSTGSDEIWMRLGGAARAAGDAARARDAFARVYYDHPLSTLSPLAAAEYERLGAEPLAPLSLRHTRELGRAEALFAAGRTTDARTAFETVRESATGHERDLVDIRLGQIDQQSGRARAAHDRLRAHIDRGPRQAEARFAFARALRDLRDHAAYVRHMRLLVERHPGDRWAEEALNSLGTHYVLVDDEETADAVFRELFAKYPKSPHAQRAAWRAGWRAYRRGLDTQAIAFFEHAAAAFPRSDYRPSWLYWSGRAHERLGNRTMAADRYMLVAADYLNSYYGRLAAARLDGRRPPARVVGDAPGGFSAPPPNEPVVRALLEARRYDDALKELGYARSAWGDSPSIQATISWIQRRQGQNHSGPEQFALLRGSITTMRRAYPQFMAAGGEDLPREVLTHIFPIAYWDLLQKYAAAHRIDRFLLAALVAQESTFVPAVRSSAGAVGLMQLMPATARAYAARLKLPYSARLLTDPEANVRMGTAYLADKIREFGDVHLALASYNAGERAVRRWMAERQGVPREEFIDDIPYPETQNYVKRILGTAEDYRRLYGS